MWDANYSDPRRMVGQLKWVHCSSHLSVCGSNSHLLFREAATYVMRDRHCCHKCNALLPDWTNVQQMLLPHKIEHPASQMLPNLKLEHFSEHLNLTWNQSQNIYFTNLWNFDDNCEDEENRNRRRKLQTLWHWNAIYRCMLLTICTLCCACQRWCH